MPMTIHVTGFAKKRRCEAPHARYKRRERPLANRNPAFRSLNRRSSS